MAYLSKKVLFIIFSIIVFLLNIFIFPDHLKNPYFNLIMWGRQAHSYKLIIIIPCLLLNADLRMRVRSSYSECSYNATFPMKTIFYIGGNATPVESKVWENFTTEMKTFNDITFDNGVLDTYRNLSLKMIRALQWTRQQYPQVPYVLKTDIDVYIQVNNLVSQLYQKHGIRKNESDLPMTMGLVFDSENVNRNKNSKLYVKEEDFPRKVYPPYCIGLAYVLNRQAIDIILQNYSRYVTEDVPCVSNSDNASISTTMRPQCKRNIISVEDAFINGVLLEHTVLLKRIRGERFCPVNCKWTEDVVALHGVWPSPGMVNQSCFSLVEKLNLLM